MSEHYIVRVYESELELITDETFGHQELETGGSLFGLLSHGGGPTVFLATRPSGDVRKTATSLHLDPRVTLPLEELAWGRFGVQSIGMWHSHHWIGLREPSGGDRDRTRRYAERHHRPQYAEILANFVGTPGSAEDAAVQLTPFWYLDARQLTRAETVIQVLPGTSPLRRALGEVEVDPLLAEALRPAGRLPEDAYRLAASRGTGPTGWRRFLPGQHANDAPAEDPAEDFDEVTDDAPPEGPPKAEPPEPDHTSPRPEEREPAQRPGAAVKPRAGKKPGRGEETAPDEETVTDGETAPDEAPRPDGTGPVHPTLRPIPDFTEYVVHHVQPVTRRLSSRFEVVLEPGGPLELFVIISLRGSRARFVIRAGWDGGRAVATQCRIEDRRRVVYWPPGRDGRLTFELAEPLYWGIQQLERLR